MGITTITLCAFALIATWAILRTLGGERQRRIDQLKASLQPASPPPPPAATPQKRESLLLPPKRKAA
jgi:hypothetical protein